MEGQKESVAKSKSKVSSSAITLKSQCFCLDVKWTPGWGDLAHHLLMHLGRFMPIQMKRAQHVIYTICCQLPWCWDFPEIKPVFLGLMKEVKV